MAKQFRIYYMKPEHFSTYVFGDEVPTKARLAETHVELCLLLADTIDHVFWKMQAEKWSPRGEARELIKEKGLCHTSMCVGDVCEDIEEGKFYVCCNVGWRRIE